MTTENTTGRSRRGERLSNTMALAPAHSGDRPADVLLWGQPCVGFGIKRKTGAMSGARGSESCVYKYRNRAGCQTHRAGIGTVVTTSAQAARRAAESHAFTVRNGAEPVEWTRDAQAEPAIGEWLAHHRKGVELGVREHEQQAAMPTLLIVRRSARRREGAMPPKALAGKKPHERVDCPYVFSSTSDQRRDIVAGTVDQEAVARLPDAGLHDCGHGRWANDASGLAPDHSIGANHGIQLFTLPLDSSAQALDTLSVAPRLTVTEQDHGSLVAGVTLIQEYGCLPWDVDFGRCNVDRAEIPTDTALLFRFGFKKLGKLAVRGS